MSVKICNYFKGGLIDSLKYFRRKIILGCCNILCFSPSFKPSQDVKTFLLRFLFNNLGKNIKFSEYLYILYGDNISIGNDSAIGTHCKIYDFSPITIGCNLLASHGLTLISATHDPSTYESRSGPILIGNNVWIGINVTIVGPVRIGDNAVIGAGSLVIRDIPDNAITAGVPAKVIRYK
jgi:maltose O-acetyltransferase